MELKTTLSLLVHGESKIGKSWLGASGPYPRLVIDLEGRSQYLPDPHKILWDPRQAPPLADGSWSTCIVKVLNYDTLSLVYDWLRTGQHHFRSVSLDSLMEAQKRAKDMIAGQVQFDQQDWGQLLIKLEALVRNYRDLAQLPDNTIEVVCLIVGTVDRDGMKRPLLEGALRTTVPYYMDCIGYLHMQPQEDGSLRRALLIEAQPGFVAGDGTHSLRQAYGPLIYEPNLEQMWEVCKRNGKAEAADLAVAATATATQEVATV